MGLVDEYHDLEILSRTPRDHLSLARLAARIAERKTSRVRMDAWAKTGLEHLRKAGVNVPTEYFRLSPYGKLEMLKKLLKGV